MAKVDVINGIARAELLPSFMPMLKTAQIENGTAFGAKKMKKPERKGKRTIAREAIRREYRKNKQNLQQAILANHNKIENELDVNPEDYDIILDCELVYPEDKDEAEGE